MSETAISSIDKSTAEIIDYRSQESKPSLLRNREMYNIDKFSPVTEDDIERYVKSNEKLVKELPPFIQSYLTSSDWKVKAMGVRMISQLTPEVQDKFRPRMGGLIERGLAKDDLFSKACAASMIPYASREVQDGLREKLPSIIETGLESEYDGTNQIALDMIEYAPAARKADFIKTALNKSSLQVKAAKMISKAPAEAQDELRKIVADLIRTDLASQDGWSHSSAVSMIPYAPVENQAEFIQICYSDPDQQVRSTISHMFPKVKDAVKAEATQKTEDNIELDSALDLKLKALATRTPLYDKSTGRFLLQDFEKTGSYLTLLDTIPGQPDNTLRERLIMRTITADAYFSWKKVYEASDFWKSKGFDYVPIEPIVKVKSKGMRHVDVFAKVLKGPSFGMWEKETKLFRQTILEQRNKIIACLEELGLDHGHAHYGNFIVYFSRNEDGEADLTTPPKLYLIDFDQAESGRV